MLWHALQAAIVFSVIASNIHWKWTPNGYLAAGLGYLAALIITGLIVRLIERRKGIPKVPTEHHWTRAKRLHG